MAGDGHAWANLLQTYTAFGGRRTDLRDSTPQARCDARAPHFAVGRADTMAGTILLVDDDAVVRQSVRRALRPLNCRIVEAPSGPRAMQMIRSERPHLYIVDIDLPGMNGWEFISRLRQEGKLRGEPVIVLSTKKGWWNGRVMPRLMKVKAHFRKPVKPDELREAVEKHLPG